MLSLFCSFHNKRKASMVDAKFKLSDYEVQFELMLKQPELRSNFKTFLEQTFVSEMFLFLEDMDELMAADEEEKQLLYSKMYEKYLSSNSEHELNLDGELKKQITLSIKNKDQERSAVLFQKTLSLVNRDMKSDAFSRYLRSSLFEQFGSKRESLIKSVSVHVSQVPNRALLYLPKDLVTETTIESRDIRFIFNLLEDSKDWIGGLIDDKEDFLSTFCSRTSYSIGGSNGLRLCKISAYLPCSAYKAMMIFSDQPLLLKCAKDEMYGYASCASSLGYKSIDASTPYSLHFSQYIFESGVLFRPRSFHVIETALYLFDFRPP
ncbi:regulator of G-protein signaling [Acrasis kona]|uniref:Regulator of G-protein signaling n=1 Tax=Acrasis kona TaxID=1008807 RepID=A0AAW2YM71_9EUKA